MPVIRIDATALEHTMFVIPGQTGWTDGTNIQQLDLPVGDYSYQIGSGFYCDFSFSVTEAGTIAYDPAYEAFLEGSGTDTLRLLGFSLTLDARYLPGLGIIWCGDMPSTGWFQTRTCRLLPASRYRVQQGSGVVCDLVFCVGLDGHFTYEAALDVGAGGPLRGAGTTTLELLGFPVLIDARGAGSGLQVHPIAWGVPFASSGVVLANVLPAPGFRIQLESGVVTGAGFDLDQGGIVTVQDCAPLTIELDTFQGVRRVRVHAPAQVDVQGAGSG